MWNSATHLLTKPHYRPKQHVNPQLKHCRVLASYIGKSVVLVLVTVSPHSELTRLHFINSSVWNYHVEQWAYGRVFRFVDLFCFWGLSITGCCHKVTCTRHYSWQGSWHAETGRHPCLLVCFPVLQQSLCSSSNKAYKWPRECEHSSFLCRWCPIWRHQWFSLHITTQSWSVVQKFSWRLSRQLVHQVCFSLHLILSCCSGSKHNTYISDAFENSRVN